MGQRRLARPRKMDDYRLYVASLEGEGGWEAQQQLMGEAETEAEVLQTELMLALRTDVGVNTAAIAARFPRDGLGAAAAAACADAARELPAAWIEFDAVDGVCGDNLTGDSDTGDNATGGTATGGIATGDDAAGGGALEGGARRLRLSDPEGLLFSNDAISTVFARLEERLEATARREAREARGTKLDAGKKTKKGEQWA